MTQCIKTGAILSLTEDTARDLEVPFDGAHPPILYGDVYLMRGVCIIYYPKPGLFKHPLTHGTLVLRDHSYWQRSTKPYRTLVVPAGWITWVPGALHLTDSEAFRRALEGAYNDL